MQSKVKIPSDYDAVKMPGRPQVGTLSVRVVETAEFPIIAGEGPGIGVMVEQTLQRFAEQGSDVLSLSVDISAELWRGMGGRTTRNDD